MTRVEIKRGCKGEKERVKKKRERERERERKIEKNVNDRGKEAKERSLYSPIF